MKKLLAILIILSTLISLSSCKLFKKDEEADPSSINGIDIDKYVIVYDEDGLDYNKRAAEHIQATVLERSGVQIQMVDDSAEKQAHEIIVGETSRDLSRELNAETEGFEFAIMAKDGSIALEGDYFVISAAAYFFTETYVLASGCNAVLEDGVSIHEPISKKADNLILLIGDGMGLYQTLLYDYLEDVSDYSDGESAFYGYMFPSQGFSRTSSYTGTTDSAAGGTAMATGYKTYNKYIGMDKDGNAKKSITELAAELGKATAIMSSETQTGATPSAFSAHTNDRDNTSDIREAQFAMYNQYGTVFECGFDYYNARYMTVIENKITTVLDTLSADSDGFFLMYEEAHIDKKSAKNDMEGTFLALIRFNQAIARFMEYAFYNPNTAVVITADHETGGLLPTEDGTLAYNYEDHTAADVPVFAWGEGTEVLDGKTIENIEIAKLFAGLMGVEKFGDQSDDWYNDIYPSENEPSIEPEEPEMLVPSETVFYSEGDKVGLIKMLTYDENGESTVVYDPAANNGKVTLINFWGVWCPYCLYEMPYLDQLATEYADIVDIVALHTVDEESENRDYIKSNYADSKIIFGEDKATVNGEVVNEYYYFAFGGYGSFPHTVVIDPNGVVYYVVTGAMNYDSFKMLIMGAYANAG